MHRKLTFFLSNCPCHCDIVSKRERVQIKSDFSHLVGQSLQIVVPNQHSDSIRPSSGRIKHMRGKICVLDRNRRLHRKSSYLIYVVCVRVNVFLLSCIIVCYFYSCLWHVSGIALCLVFEIKMVRDRPMVRINKKQEVKNLLCSRKLSMMDPSHLR